MTTLTNPNTFTMQTHNSFEAKTNELFSNPKLDGMGWEVAAIKQVFKACWSYSMDIDHISRVACAIHGIRNAEETAPVFQKHLTRLCKLGILRSRMTGKRRLYEVNY